MGTGAGSVTSEWLDPAPTVPRRLAVSGEASGCLGTALVARQSGIYLDRHRSGRGGPEEKPAAGARVGGEREKLLSRVSFAAMEQFLRIAVPFGVTHYKAGLDHCRTEAEKRTFFKNQFGWDWP